MESITKTLSGIVAAAFTACGYDGTLGHVTVSDRLDLCQFQCNGAFAGAKRYRKAPLRIAEEIAEKLKTSLSLIHILAVCGKRPSFSPRTNTHRGRCV